MNFLVSVDVKPPKLDVDSKTSNAVRKPLFVFHIGPKQSYRKKFDNANSNGNSYFSPLWFGEKCSGGKMPLGCGTLLDMYLVENTNQFFLFENQICCSDKVIHSFTLSKAEKRI